MVSNYPYSRTSSPAESSSKDRPHAPRRMTMLRRPAVGLLAVAALGLSLLAPGQAGADPDTKASITAELAKLGHENEQLTEQYLAAVIDVDAKAAAATAADASADAAEATYVTARGQFKSSLVEQYTGSSFSRTAALLTSESGQAYLDQLETLNMINIKRSTELTALTAAKESATAARTAAEGLLAQATAQRDSLAEQRADLDAEQAAYTAKLNVLNAAEQAAYFAARAAAPAATTSPTVAAPTAAAPAETEQAAAPAPSEAAAIAVETAMAQRGKPYVYAAGGPGSFDCSGLTAYAWAAAGVNLPHNAAAQYGYGTRVSLSALQPGDLVFYYSPIGHVGIYIGNGQIVHAPTSGDVVRVAAVNASGTPIGATRL